MRVKIHFMGGLLGVLLMVATVRADVVPPDGLVDRLSSESYPERVAAETDLRAWASENGKEAWKWLAESVEEESAPELQERALKVLKQVVLEDLSGKRPGFVGITMEPAEIDDEQGGGFGVRVKAVSPGTPAEKAGLKPQDIVLSLNDEEWTEKETDIAFGLKIGAMNPGAKVKLGILRGEDRMDIELELGARPWTAGEFNPQQQMFRPLGGRFLSESQAREKVFEEWYEDYRSQLKKEGAK